MGLSDAAKAGAALFVGTVQFGIFMILAETVYPGYSVSSNFISDLGPPCPSGIACGSQYSWMIFDTSIILLGILGLVTAYYIQRYFKWKPATGLFVLSAIGLIGVGIFNETAPFDLHGIFSLITFLGIGLAAVVSFWLQKPPLSYFSVILGMVTLIMLIFYLPGTGDDFGNLFGIGPGGLERMIVYPTLLWGVAFGGHLMGLEDQSKR